MIADLIASLTGQQARAALQLLALDDEEDVVGAIRRVLSGTWPPRPAGGTPLGGCVIRVRNLAPGGATLRTRITQPPSAADPHGLGIPGIRPYPAR